MKAVGYQHSLPIQDEASLIDVELPRPSPSGRDLLVRVLAISVNPVDAKMRLRSVPQNGLHRVLGWDASGIVEDVGREATLCLLYTSPSPRDGLLSRMPSSA